MDLISAILLGIVEGLTEFLPVSSTGHLILVNQVIKFQHGGDAFVRMFDVVINSGAILSVILFFRNKINPFSLQKTSEERTQTWSIWFKVFVAFLPAGIIGLAFGKKIQENLFNPAVVAGALLVGGIILIVIELMKNKKSDITTVAQITYRTAFFIGLFQCLGMVPGTSRSAATIIGAMLLGLSRENAAEFSFYLAIPTLVLAGAFSVMKAGFAISGFEWLVLAVGFAVSFATAWVVISFFMNYIRKHDFKPFGYYRIALGALILLLFLFGKLNV
jgi:undecaprenyl-diphosphatase